MTDPKILVDRLQWEMAEWEIHALRGLISVALVQTRLLARRIPEAAPIANMLEAAKDKLMADALVAMRDPAKRNERR